MVVLGFRHVSHVLMTLIVNPTKTKFIDSQPMPLENQPRRAALRKFTHETLQIQESTYCKEVDFQITRVYD